MEACQYAFVMYTGLTLQHFSQIGKWLLITTDKNDFITLYKSAALASGRLDTKNTKIQSQTRNGLKRSRIYIQHNIISCVYGN
jgi:hypothetical protein